MRTLIFVATGLLLMGIAMRLASPGRRRAVMGVFSVGWLLAKMSPWALSGFYSLWPQDVADATVVAFLSALDGYAHQPVVDGESRFFDVSGVDRSTQDAVRFAVMPAVAEAALAKIGAEFVEGVLDFLPVEMAEPEFLQAGRVDQVAVGRDVIKRGVRRCVLAGIECFGNFPCGGTGIRDQGVDEG